MDGVVLVINELGLNVGRLSAENKQLLEEIKKLREENARLKANGASSEQTKTR